MSVWVAAVEHKGQQGAQFVDEWIWCAVHLSAFAAKKGDVMGGVIMPGEITVKHPVRRLAELISQGCHSLEEFEEVMAYRAQLQTALAAKVEVVSALEQTLTELRQDLAALDRVEKLYRARMDAITPDYPIMDAVTPPGAIAT